MLSNFWLWQFLGRLHPLIVHFPIGLLIVSLVLELFTRKGKNQELRTAIHIILIIGAASAIFAASFGWLLKSQDEYSDDVLTVHQWTGIAVAILASACALLHRQIFKLKKGSLLIYRTTLATTVLLVIIAGHYGATLTHGEDYFTSVLPGNEDFNRKPLDMVSFSKQTTYSKEQIADLHLEVRSIFAHNCYKCHSATKTKGELRLDIKKLAMRGGKSGKVIEAGHPEKSEMIRRLRLPRADKESMPPKGKTLSEKEIATLELWMKIGAPWPDSTDQRNIYRVAKMEPRKPDLPPAKNGLSNPVDLLVDKYFTQKNLTWPAVVDDRRYIRRVYLDVIGLLPTPEQIETFVADGNPDKRVALVKELLNRNDDYAQHWLSFWNDALRNDYSGTGYITNGRFAITEWLYASLRENKPYDQFVKELISPDKRSEGFIRGIQWRGTINASQRTEMQAAQNISQIFLGLNMKCASCHDSFISDLKLKDAYAFANIFSDTTLAISRCDVPTGEWAGTRIIFNELGSIDSTLSVKGKLEQLAQFLSAPKDGRLYRTIVNRVWAQLMGRGIVEPVDVMDNEPWSQDLLDWLAADFNGNGNDVKKLIFLITTSQTYQLPSVGVKEESEILSKAYTFKGMHRKRLTAEQFSDAVSSIIYPVYLDTLMKFDPFKNSAPLVTVPYARASLVLNDPFLTALGRPNRENVSTSRSSQANLLQALELTNGNKFNKTLESGAKKWKQEFITGDKIADEVYRRALGRNPVREEKETAIALLGAAPAEASIEDLLWSIVLLPEFQLIY